MNFPGGVGVSGLRVYDWPTADNLCGGSPHMHLACAEAYVVVEGRGSVQTVTWHEGYLETPLEAGDVVSFTPGTIHRLVNADGKLRIVVIMANSGLPEAGDAVFTFPPDILADRPTYDSAALAQTPQQARQRRDLAIVGFQRLREQGRSALDAFHRAAAALVAARLDDFETRWRAGALAAANSTGEQLTQLRQGDITHLRDARLTSLVPHQAIGMCGYLDRY